MFLNKRNNHIYSANTFDKSQNVYAIRVNEQKLESITYELLNNKEIRYRYNILRRELIFYLSIDDDVNIKSSYKVIYGHFYNNANDFLYKRTFNNKVVNINIYRCKKSELLHNNFKRLIYSDSYDIIDKQVNSISKNQLDIIKKEYIKPFDIAYDKELKMLIINHTIDINDTAKFDYNDNCIILHKQ